MFRKNYFTFLFCIALFLACGSVALAQTYPVTGRVMLTKADGTTVPVEGALVEVFREDSKIKLPSDKTDKKGNFAFAGLQPGWKYILSVSGTGISPTIYPGVGAGAEKIVVNVTEGDGKRYTEEEVKTNFKNRTSSSSTTTSSTTNKNEPTEDEKKAEAERLRLIAENAAKNAKIENANKIVGVSLQDGDKAFKEKNWTLAIQKFDEGFNANPEFAGSAPVFLNNKGMVLIRRGTETYNQAVKGDENAKAAGREAAKKDYDEAIAASEKALAILKTASTTDANTQKIYEGQKLFALTNRKEAYRLLSRTGADRTKGKEALTAYREYIALETNVELKTKSQHELAQTLQDSNEFELSVAEFEKILAADPANIDALAGIGLSLVNVGYVNMEADAAKGKAQLQQAANYLQKFVDIAPDTHPYKDEAKTVILTLKSQQNLTPQKVTTPKKKT